MPPCHVAFLPFPAHGHLAELGHGTSLRERDVGEQIRGSVAEIVADAGTRHTVRVIQDELRDTGGPELAPTTS